MSFLILSLPVENYPSIKLGMLLGIARVQSSISEEVLVLTIEYDPQFTNSGEIESIIRGQAR